MFRSVVLVCVVLSLVTGPVGAAATAGGGAPDISASQAGPETNGTNTTSSNDSVAHRDPDTVGQEGDLEGLRSWLIGQLAGRLGEGAIQLSQGEYDAARKLVGDQYSDRLDQLVDVAGETETTRTYRRTQENQREMANATNDYRETYDDYRDARENGNNERARELARELEGDAQRVRENARDTRDGFGGLGNQTGQNFTDARTAVTEVEQNITDTQEQVRRSTFEATNLSVSADGEAVSFIDPLALSGELTTENGSVIAEEDIRLQVGNRTYRTETDEEGAFTVDYRPTELPLNISALPVEYQPAGSSPYLNSSTTVPVDVEQVTPTVSVNASPQRIAFNERLSVSGAVRADDVGAPVPIAVYLGGTRVATVRSDGNGSYQTTLRVPARIDNGTRNVTARIAQTDRALASTNASTTVDVRETATGLTANASSIDDGPIRVSGTLQTEAGTAVANQPITVSIGGQTLDTVQTKGEGRYTARIDPAELGDANGSMTINVAYRGEGTNLEASRANATTVLAGVNSGGGEPADEWSLFGTDMRIALLIGLLVLGLLAALGIRYWSGREGSEPDDSPPAVGDAPTSAVQRVEPTSSVSLSTRLESAREQLAAGDIDASVVTLYTAMRAQFGQQGVRRGLTHWEFYNASADDLESEERSFLERLTSAYEQAVFSPLGVSEETAEDLLERTSQSSDSSTSAD
ncbi:DUF4129 domain-containing protein [Halomarina salina]|uniref:DUF4129 domain-containing protein n=1 Tax=Halomarina salina TaxID=1872699 RepID=A0ABD5RT28_9EURY|nr:DUF4129 domain-containing protein [Halomarina salina]